MKTLTHTETHFGLQDLDWQNCGGFEQLATDVTHWLERDLSEREKADLYSLYLQNVENC